MTETKYSIVVPVYKSTTSLIELAKRTELLFAGLPEANYELIFVNDSPFHLPTGRVLESLTKENENILAIELTKNFGQQPATLCGLNHARGDYIITMDDDLQHHPEDIPKLMEQREHDVVIAKFIEKKHSLFKRITSNIKGHFDHIILGKPKSLKLSSFRLINGEVASLMCQRKTPYPFIPALLFGITNDFVNVELEHHPRLEGTSNYSILKMIRVFSNLLIGNSSMLLRMVGYFGVTVAIIAAFLSVALILKKLFFGYALVGWTSIVLLILFFGGATLFTLGVIGEYLVRIIATTEERPVYVVRGVRNNRTPQTKS